MTACVVDEMAAVSVSASAGTKVTPGTSGWNGSRYEGCQVVESAPSVRPWNERSSAMTSLRVLSPAVCQ